jgi:branched-subunit amino acid transport protein
MSDLGLIAAMGVGVFLLRVAGLALPAATIPPAWERALGFVPVSLLAALVVVSLTGNDRAGWEGTAAVAAGAAVVLRTGRLWTCIASGLVAFWLLRLI